MSIKIVENNIDNVISDVNDVKKLILENIGIKAEKYAKALCPVGTPESTGIKGYRGGTLRNSITYEVEGDQLYVGTNVEYAPYVELGTGTNFKSPPEWESFQAVRGSGKKKGGMMPRYFLRDAIQNHLDEYKNIIEKMLKQH